MPETAPRAGAQAGKVARGSSREVRLCRMVARVSLDRALADKLGQGRDALFQNWNLAELIKNLRVAPAYCVARFQAMTPS